MLNVVLRALPPLAATEKPTVPDPDWMLVDVMLTNDPLEVADQAHAPPVVTPIVALPPALAMLNVVVVIAYVHV